MSTFFEEIQVRRVTLPDVPELVEVHADVGDPWAEVTECSLWVNHRLLRPFYGDVAVAGGRVLGHAEWILSHEPEPFGRQLYLGMLQVHAHYRKCGIGRALVEHGLGRAKELGCDRIQTIPEQGSERFYERCGLTPHLQTATYLLQPNRGRLPVGWKRKPGVPARVVELLPMRFGWVQACSKHMWEISNRGVRIAGSRIRHLCVRRNDDQGYIQLRYLGTGPEAMALAWASIKVDLQELMVVGSRLAQSLPVNRLSLTVWQGEKAQIERQVKLVNEETVWSAFL